MYISHHLHHVHVEDQADVSWESKFGSGPYLWIKALKGLAFWDQSFQASIDPSESANLNYTTIYRVTEKIMLQSKVIGK